MNPDPSKVGVLGIGFDANSSFRRGPAEAPPRIREALSSESANAYSETGFRVWPSDEVIDHGDLDIPDESGSRAPIDAIEHPQARQAPEDAKHRSATPTQIIGLFCEIKLGVTGRAHL